MIMKKERFKLPCIECITFPICNSIYNEIQNYRWLSQEVRYSIFLSKMYQKCSLMKHYLCAGNAGSIRNRFVNKVCRYYNSEITKVDPTDIIVVR